MSALVKRVSFTYNYSIAANSTLDVTGTNLEMTIPAGYTMMSVLRSSAQNANVEVINLFPQTGNHIAAQLYNRSSSTQTGTYRIDIACMLTGCITTV